MESTNSYRQYQFASNFRKLPKVTQLNYLKLIVKLIEEAQRLIGIFDSNETVNYPPTIVPLSFSILHLDDQLILDHIFYTRLKKY